MLKLLLVVLFVSLLALSYVSFSQTNIATSPYKKINSHEYWIFGEGINEYLDATNILSISKVALIPTGKPPNNAGYKENMLVILELQKSYPEKILAYCHTDESSPDSLEVFEMCLKNGGKALKLPGDLFDYYFEAWNSSKRYVMYRLASEYRIPILIHVGPHIQERLDQLEQAIGDFPNVTFIMDHYCSEYRDNPPTFSFCTKILDNYPNVYVDASYWGSLGQWLDIMQKHNGIFRDFMIKYQDRFVWGPGFYSLQDKKLSKEEYLERLSCSLNLFEKDYFKCKFSSTPSAFLKGLNLPTTLLQKMYWDNPAAIFRLS